MNRTSEPTPQRVGSLHIVVLGTGGGWSPGTCASVAEKAGVARQKFRVLVEMEKK